MVQFITKPKSLYDNPDEKLSTVACTVPYRYYEIHRSGLVSICCFSWLPTWVGNLLTESVQQVIDNAERKLIQDNMRCGNFSHCNDQCPQLNSFLHDGNPADYWNIVPKKNLDRHLAARSVDVYFSYDHSCNLQCPSCRDGLIVWNPNDPNDPNGQRLKVLHEKVKHLINLLLAKHNKVVLSITGSGDPFASELYWNYLLELAREPIYENLMINLQTNGVMMTEKNWKLIEPLWPNIQFVNISVDAATEEVYKVVRKNGNFKKLKKNLEVFDQMVANGCFPNLKGWQTNFIVQRDNYKDLKAFIEWQLEYKSKPRIWTNLLAQWHHMSDKQFNSMAVWQESHPDRAELLEILKDPIFKNPQVKLGNVNSFVPND